MSTIKDDPEEVLAILNSLGFVGVTALQLKAFMKDLKLYRKIRERERQLKKEEIKKKIIRKHQSVVKEVLREHNAEQKNSMTESTVSCTTSSSNLYIDDSLVKVRVRCLQDDKQAEIHRSTQRNLLNVERTMYLLRTEEGEGSQRPDKRTGKENCRPKFQCGDRESRHVCRTELQRSVSLEHLNKKIAEKDEHQCNRKHRIKGVAEKVELHCAKLAGNAACGSAAESELTKTARSRSASAMRSSARSGAKSFIRPWRLQGGAQKGGTMKKSDPVSLYQKYQQEWNKISFPGEAKRTNVRWAVREKMLGVDPRPTPLPNMSSVPIPRKN